MKELVENIYGYIIATIVDITNESYYKNMSNSDYMNWLYKMKEASRALNEAIEESLKHFEKED